MGIVTFGPHEQSLLDIAKLLGARVFIETGTYKGTTARWAAEHFDEVHTIELSEAHYNYYSSQLGDAENIQTHLGDSRVVLPKILDQIGGAPAVFWLDGHWSGGKTAGAADQCPVLDEIELIKNRGSDLIMIDDARLFLSVPPKPLDANQWPTFFDIAEAFLGANQKYFTQVFNDTVFVVPKRSALIETLRRHAHDYTDNQ